MQTNGISTTKPGEEKYKPFSSDLKLNKTFIQYDYRHPDGDLFMTIATTLEKCRKKRDKWLTDNNKIIELTINNDINKSIKEIGFGKLFGIPDQNK